MLVALSQATSSTIKFTDLIPYYVLISLTFPVFKTSIDYEIGELTHSGEINNYLVRPIRIYLYFLTTEISKKIATLLILLPFISIPIIYFHYQFNAVLVFAAVIVSFLVSFNLSYLFGLSMFWLDEFWVIRNVNDVLTTLLGGVVLPYIFFPTWAMTIIRFTPFPYMISMPARIIQDTAQPFDILIGLVWVFILYSINVICERQIIYKYSHTA